jgi:hypothetical protein
MTNVKHLTFTRRLTDFTPPDCGGKEAKERSNQDPPIPQKRRDMAGARTTARLRDTSASLDVEKRECVNT